jgi:hypothetical protein
MLQPPAIIPGDDGDIACHPSSPSGEHKNLIGFCSPESQEPDSAAIAVRLQILFSAENRIIVSFSQARKAWHARPCLKNYHS